MFSGLHWLPSYALPLAKEARCIGCDEIRFLLQDMCAVSNSDSGLARCSTGATGQYNLSADHVWARAFIVQNLPPTTHEQHEATTSYHGRRGQISYARRYPFQPSESPLCHKYHVFVWPQRCSPRVTSCRVFGRLSSGWLSRHCCSGFSLAQSRWCSYQDS